MILKEVHSDISRYFKEDCYCPNEVYSVDGFFFVLIHDDAECKLINTFEDGKETIYLVATYDTKNNPYLVTIWSEDGRVTDMLRTDLTEHNINELTAFFKNEKSSVSLSEDEEIIKSVKDILSTADAIMLR